MTDHNQNTPQWNDPNGRPSQNAGDVEGGNQSGGQQPSGQPGEYTQHTGAVPDGQYGQPGEYAGPTQNAPEGHYGQPGEYAHPDPAAAQPGYTDQFGQPGQYGHQSQHGQQGQFGQQGQHGQFAPDGQPAYGQPTPPHQSETGQHPPYGQQMPPAGYPAAAPQQKERKPRTDENGEPYGVGPFTLRETIVAGLGVLLLIASFLPLIGGEFASYVGYSNLWGPAPWLVIPGALLFIAAAALIVLRRTVPSVRWRVGSLSIDQFASAAAIITAGFHLGTIFLVLGLVGWLGGSVNGFIPGAGPILGLIVALAAIALTTFGNRIPPFSSDFAGRPASEAHPLARAPKAVPQRPKPEPQVQQSWDGGQNQQTDGWPTTAPAGQANGYDAAQAASWPQDTSEPWPGTPAASQEAQAPDAPYAAVGPSGHSATASGRDETPADPRAVFDGQAAEATATESSAPAGSAHEPTPTTAYEPIDESTILRDPRAGSAASASETRADQPVADEPVVEFAVDEPSITDAPEEQAPAPAAFAPYWVLAPESRPVVDISTGSPLFDVGPTAWALAVGEHDGGLVIRADDGRVGVLRRIDDLTRG